MIGVDSTGRRSTDVTAVGPAITVPSENGAVSTQPRLSETPGVGPVITTPTPTPTPAPVPVAPPAGSPRTDEALPLTDDLAVPT